MVCRAAWARARVLENLEECLVDQPPTPSHAVLTTHHKGRHGYPVNSTAGERRVVAFKSSRPAPGKPTDAGHHHVEDLSLERVMPARQPDRARRITTGILTLERRSRGPTRHSRGTGGTRARRTAGRRRPPRRRAERWRGAPARGGGAPCARRPAAGRPGRTRPDRERGPRRPRPVRRRRAGTSPPQPPRAVPLQPAPAPTDAGGTRRIEVATRTLEVSTSSSASIDTVSHGAPIASQVCDLEAMSAYEITKSLVSPR